MDRKTPEEYSAIAFYGIASTAGLMENFYNDIVEWFSKAGKLIDRSSVRVSIDKIGRSGSWISLDKAEEKLRKQKYDDITSISVNSLRDNAAIPTNDYLLSSYCSLNRDRMYIASKSSIFFLSHEFMLSVADKFINNALPKYGIGYTRDHSLGPAMYAIGLAQGLGRSGDDSLESLNISFWGDAIRMRVWEIGLVRDIYPWNFLSPVHLQKKIGNLTLNDWIVSDADRGSLTEIKSGITLWEVASNNIGGIRRTLLQEDLIFDWTRHIPGAEEHPSAQATRAWLMSR